MVQFEQFPKLKFFLNKSLEILTNFSHLTPLGQELSRLDTANQFLTSKNPPVHSLKFPPLFFGILTFSGPKSQNLILRIF